MRQFPIVALLCGLLFAGGLPLIAQSENLWPFGQSSERRGGFDGLDLYNLGLIGAKARDADQPLRRRGEGSGGRSQTREPGDEKNDGPERLAIEILFPEGPAMKAGLQVGDVLVGVQKTKFKDSSLTLLADALQKAEIAKRSELDLMVERTVQGQVQRLNLTVKLPKVSAKPKDPTRGDHRQDILTAALNWLKERQNSDGSFPETLGGRTGALVMTSVAGLAWVGGGSISGKGPHGPEVKKAFEWVAKNLDAKDPFPRGRGGANWDQSNWAYAYAGLFFGELLERDPSSKLLRKELQRIVEHLVSTQEQSGGWAHGPGGKNALEYLELNIVTGLVLSALGQAARHDIPVDKDAVTRAVAYLKESSSGGGVGYSTADGQRGQGNIGRSAAAYLGLNNLKLANSGFGADVKSYVARESDKIFGGHASLMQHIFFAGIAAEGLGKSSAKSYWDVMLRDLTLARSPDGSLQPRPWHESLSMNSNSDVTLGDVWTTASWASVLAADLEAKGVRGLKGLQGAKRK